MPQQKVNAVFDRRRAAVLLHPTSLPHSSGPGEIGTEAYNFVDFLHAGGVSIWQMLPLCPTHADGSPYMGLSVLAGDPNLISLQMLRDWGWLRSETTMRGTQYSAEERAAALCAAHAGFIEHANRQDRMAWEQFLVEHQAWLDDYALFVSLRQAHDGKSWVDWPAAIRDRQVAALNKAASRLDDAIAQIKFEQFVFFRQWHLLRDYARDKGVLLFGDMPIFVAHDSAEVWANRAMFDLNEDGRARNIAGVPPDYFSATGQRWGNPLYNWERMADTGYEWWATRIAACLELFDLVRVDHFRGFEAYWQIAAEEETAINGHWVKAPGKDLFDVLSKRFGSLPIVAEDLGVITAEVDALRTRYGWPGMKILQFAFDGNSNNPYLPHNHERQSVVYTGTHDNDTTLGWFNALDTAQQATVSDYLGAPSEAMPWSLIRTALASTAQLAVIPMQDLLALGSEHRMNTPGQNGDNWSWQYAWSQVPPDLAARVRHLVTLYDRLA